MIIITKIRDCEIKMCFFKDSLLIKFNNIIYDKHFIYQDKKIYEKIKISE